MTAYADTSFLVSLYLTDSNSGSAVSLMRRLRGSPLLTPFQHLELRNALRLCVFRKLIAPERLRAAVEDIEHDLRHAIFIPTTVAWGEIYEIAERLSGDHTGDSGTRTLDILHVASALSLSARDFLTFDARQAVLAKKAGLKVKP